jgi:hypothetical protein
MAMKRIPVFAMRHGNALVVYSHSVPGKGFKRGPKSTRRGVNLALIANNGLKTPPIEKQKIA